VRTLLPVFFAFTFLIAGKAAAQDFTNMVCTAKVEAPREVDASTATGLIGDILVICSGGTPTPSGQPVPRVSFELNTVPGLTITSRNLNLPGFNQYVDALLFVNDPSSQKQTLCMPQREQAIDSCPGSSIGAGDGKGTYDPAFNPNGPRRGNAWLGQAFNRKLTFSNIPFDPAGTGAETTFRLTGVRVNAAQMGVQDGERKEIAAELKMLFERVNQRIFESSLRGPAIVSNSIGFTIQNPLTLYQCEAANPGLLANTDLVEEFKIITANFAEEYGRSFGGSPLITPSAGNEFHGNPLYVHRGFYRRAQPPQWPVETGAIDGATELTMQFDNVPDGAQLFAERFFGNSARGELATDSPSAARFVRVPVVGGRADVRWIVTEANSDQRETLSPRIAVAYRANEPALGTFSVKGYGAPVNAYPRGLVPRFVAPNPHDRARAGIAAASINNCAQRNTVIPRLAVTTGFLPVGFSQQGNPPDSGKFYFFADGAPINGIRIEGPTANWLRVTPNSSRTPATMDLKVNPDPPANNLRAALLDSGSYTATFRILGEGIGAATINVPLNVGPPGPHLTRWGVTNAASYESEAVAPGEALTLFGERFGPDTLATAQISEGKFSTMIGETRVLFDGVAAPMIYAARGQLSAIAPFGLAGKAGTQIQIEYRGVRSPAVSVPVVAAAPGVLTADASGAGKAAALNQDNSFNSVVGALPAEFVVFFGIGGPATDVMGRDGEIYQAPLPRFTGPVAVFLDGVEVPAADIAYIGPAPSLVQGVWQANVRLPANAPRNGTMQIQFRFGNALTQPGVTVSVR